MKNKSLKDILCNVLKYAVLIIGAMFTLLPFIWMIASSLKTPAEIVAIPPKLFPAEPQFINYARAWAGSAVWQIPDQHGNRYSAHHHRCAGHHGIVGVCIFQIEFPG